MHLTIDEIKKSFNTSNNQNGPYVLSLSHEILSDTETPVSTFYKLCKNNPYSFLLESVEGGERLGRYSIIGLDPILTFSNKENKSYLENFSTKKTIQLEDNPYKALNNLISSFKILDSNNKDFIGFVGYFGYETVRWIEPKTNFKANKKVPDVLLTLPGKIVVFDNVTQKVKLISVSHFESIKDLEAEYKKTKEKLDLLVRDFSIEKLVPPLSPDYSNIDINNISFKSNYSKEEYMAMVEKSKKHIKAGDIFQIVPSQKLTIDGTYDGLTLYRILRSVNPSPYLYYINFKDFELCGSSPEVMVKSDDVNGKKIASLRPIAGTYPRGKDEEEDSKNIEKLSNDPKEKAEHLMLVDLARNDLGRVCETGSVKVKELMVIEKYSHVLHIVSLVQGILKKSMSSIDLLCASFPAGTLSGAPKVRALEIINEIENAQRGPYGGCTGFFGLNDSINTCMTIRTFVIFKDHLEIQAGGGIVADSDPENEYNETLRKGGALLKTLSILKRTKTI